MAAALGYAEAELNVARMYSTGRGVPRDDVEAAKWLRRAADQGRVVAETVLAAMHIAGRGVVKSDTEAAIAMKHPVAALREESSPLEKSAHRQPS